MCYQRGCTPHSRSDTRDPNPVPGGRDNQAEWWPWAERSEPQRKQRACLEAGTDQGTSQEMNGPSPAEACSQGEPGEGDADEPVSGGEDIQMVGVGVGACKPCYLSHHSLLKARWLRSENIIVFSRDYLKCRMRDRSELDRRLICVGSQSGPADKKQINPEASPRENPQASSPGRTWGWRQGSP